MERHSLTCSAISPDRLVAHFCSDRTEEEVFAYLPHVPGLNPHLLRVNDEVEGEVAHTGKRLELTAASRQTDHRRIASS